MPDKKGKSNKINVFLDPIKAQLERDIEKKTYEGQGAEVQDIRDNLAKLRDKVSHDDLSIVSIGAWDKLKQEIQLQLDTAKTDYEVDANIDIQQFLDQIEATIGSDEAALQKRTNLWRQLLWKMEKKELEDELKATI